MLLCCRKLKIILADLNALMMTCISSTEPVHVDGPMLEIKQFAYHGNFRGAKIPRRRNHGLTLQMLHPLPEYPLVSKGENHRFQILL